MEPWHRSLAGLVIALVGLPVFLALTGCLHLPVPIGNPEKSRIDPTLTGLWFRADESAIIFLEPFDQRVWLMTFVPVEFADDVCPLAEDRDLDTEEFDGFIEALGEFGADCFSAGDGIAVYKAWVTRIGGQRFMVWEPKGYWIPGIGFGPVAWYAFRLDRRSTDHVGLVMMKSKYFEDIEGYQELLDNLDAETPSDPDQVRRVARDVRRAIRKNVEDPDLYAGDDVPFDLTRIPPEHAEETSRILEQVYSPD